MKIAAIVVAALFTVACTSPRTSMVQPFSAEGAAAPIGPYSHGTTCLGRLIFLSGQVPMQADGTLLAGTIQQQTKQIFDNIRIILASQGASLTDIAKTTVFLKDMNDFAAMNEVYAAEMGVHRPARSAVEVARLPKDARLEIEVVACMP